jgi:hypothetical protein
VYLQRMQASETTWVICLFASEVVGKNPRF